MRLHLLGINGPFPESRSATSGYLLEAGDNLFQLDLGSGVVPHGSVEQLHADLGLNARGIAEAVREVLSEKDPS